MDKLLWLDDLRNPFEGEWLEKFAPEYLSGDCEIVWVKDYHAFTDWIKKNGLPTKIAFDHDLGEDVAKGKVAKGMSKRQARKEKRLTPTGLDAVEWVVDYCIDKGLEFPKWVIQSANPVGVENMRSLILNFIKHSDKARNHPPL